MSNELMSQARALRAEIDAKEATAKSVWSEYDSLKASAKSENVDFANNEEAFNRLDEKGREYDSIRDAITSDTKKWARLVEMANDGDTGAIRDVMAGKANNAEAAATLGERFTNSDLYNELKSLASVDGSAIGNSRAVKVADRNEIKTLLTTSAGGSALFRNDRIDQLVFLPQPPTNVLDVIPIGATDSDTVEWVIESTFTNAATETAEGTDASESALAYSTSSTAVREITHSLPATKKMLADGAALETYINQRLVYGIRKRLQAEVIGGDGSTPNLRGLVNISGINTQARGTDSRADAIHKAITKVRIQAEDQAQPQHILLHPTDYETLRLEKATSGDYYYGGPTAGAGFNTVWGLIPVVSTQVTQGTGIVLDVNQTTLFVREGLSVAASDSHSDFFIKRQVMFLATMRGAFAVFQPKAVCTVTGL